MYNVLIFFFKDEKIKLRKSNDLRFNVVFICYVNRKVFILEVVLCNLNLKDQIYLRIVYEENFESLEENNMEDIMLDKFDLEDSFENEKLRFEGKFFDMKELLVVIKV